MLLKYMQEGTLDEDNYYPDFPSGGVIVNKDDLSAINKTGKGKVIVQAKYSIQGQTISFTEMPYQVYIEPVIEKIKEQIEKENLIGISDVINKSDKKRILLSVECEKGFDPNKVVEMLFATTPLQMQYNANQNGIVSKTPVLLNLEKVVEKYVEHNTTCIRREHESGLEKLRIRIEILKGLLIAIANLDKVIKTIRESSSPKEKLAKAFPELTERQIKAILDMKLARLSKLENEKIEKELREKKEYAAYCKLVIESFDKQKEILIERLQELVKKYGDKRRTEVIQKEIKKVSAGKTKEKVEEVPQDIVISYNSNGYIKAIPVAQYKKSKDLSKDFKCTTADLILCFSSLGKVYRISAKDIGLCGQKDKGKILTTILNVEKNEKIVTVMSSIIDEKHPYVTIITTDAKIKKTDKAELIGATRNLNGVKYIGLDNNEVFYVVESNGDFISITTHNMLGIAFKLDDIRCTGKTSRGVIAMKLAEDDKIISCALNMLPKGIEITKRGGKGKKIKC